MFYNIEKVGRDVVEIEKVENAQNMSDLKVSGLTEVELKAKLKKGIDDALVDFSDGVVISPNKVLWGLEKDTTTYLALYDENYDGSYIKDIYSNEAYYKGKRKKVKTTKIINDDGVEETKKSEKTNTVLSLDRLIGENMTGYNITKLDDNKDGFERVEELLMSLVLINRFEYVESSLCEDSRRTELRIQIANFLTVDDSKKRVKYRKRLKDAFKKTVNGINVGELVLEMLNNEVTKGYLMDFEFNLEDYLEALKID